MANAQQNKKVYAMTKATQSSYILGKHDWVVWNDSAECIEKKASPNYYTDMKLIGRPWLVVKLYVEMSPTSFKLNI